MSKNRPMNQAAAARIQSATARKNSGKVSVGSFAARAQSAASLTTATSETPPNWPSKQEGNPSGGGRTNNPPRQR
ncbi:MAG: hypothetical protein ACRBBM_16055 [Pseudomonadaceae bacterium]